MAYRPNLRVPYGYGTATKTLAEIRVIMAEHHHPEYIERFLAWLDWCDGLVGFGGGWRATQPSKPGFAPDGKSFHQTQTYASGRKAASAVDVVRINPKIAQGGVHLTVRWSDVPKQGTTEAKTWGVHANVDQGANPEPWHIQPVEQDGWQTWVNQGRPELKAGYPFPGRDNGGPPPPPPPPPTDIYPPTDTPKGASLVNPLVLRYGGTPTGGWSGYYSPDGGTTMLPVRSMHHANQLLALGAIDGKKLTRVTNWNDVTHTNNLEELDEWLTPGRD